MRCSNCGKCCENTEMELSRKDVEKLEGAGHNRKEFTDLNDGINRLKNVDGHCYFYDAVGKKCRVYKKRPLGCHLYPIIYVTDKQAIVDTLCPMAHTVAKNELRTKEQILNRLIKKIDHERKQRIIN
jgi:Fe-S-cluster containining protein